MFGHVSCNIVHAWQTFGVGFIGSGFMTRFHIRSWEAVGTPTSAAFTARPAPTPKAAAALARSLHVGDARAFGSIESMVADESIDCIWLCGPNFARVENMERIVAAIKQGAKLRAIACEKPLARNAAEAKRMVELVEEAGVLHGYLENQLFQPSRTRQAHRLAAWRRRVGPALPRAGGRGTWRSAHAVVLAGRSARRRRPQRHDVPQPRSRPLPADQARRPRNSITPVKVSAQIAYLKWSRPEYAKLLRGTMTDKVDYARNPAEDFARATVNYVDEAGTPLIVEATTSWSYVGAGLRLSMELLGPEYSMSVSTLEGGTKVFFSRRLQEQQAGEDLIESRMPNRA